MTSDWFLIIIGLGTIHNILPGGGDSHKPFRENVHVIHVCVAE